MRITQKYSHDCNEIAEIFPGFCWLVLLLVVGKNGLNTLFSKGELGTYQPRTLFDLSTELLIEILTYLPVADLLSMQHTCRTMRSIIGGTVYLQYIVRTHINGVNDFLPPEFLYSERLELLGRHEQSWNTLQVNLLTECPPNIAFPNHKFILQDGYLIYDYLIGREKQYSYTDLSSSARNEDVDWVHITMDESRLPSGGLSAIKFAVDHDLVVTIRFRILSHPVLLVVQA